MGVSIILFLEFDVTRITYEDGLELHHAVRISRIDAAEECLVDVARVVRVSVAGLNHTGIDTRRVAVPDIPKDSFKRLARVDVNELAVEDYIHTRLVLSDVVTDQLSRNPVRSNLTLWTQEALRAGVKDLRSGRGLSDISTVRSMRDIDRGILPTGSQLPVLFHRSLATCFGSGIDSTRFEMLSALVETPSGVLEHFPLAVRLDAVLFMSAGMRGDEGSKADGEVAERVESHIC